MGNASGVFTVQSIRRRSAGDRYDVETLMSVTGVPWDPQATKLDEVPLPRIVEGDQQPLAPPVQEEKSKKTLRRLYITKRDLDKHGYTAGCPACDATRICKRSTGVHHTPACREREWSVYSMQKKAICVLPNILQRPMPKSPVKSKKCLKVISAPLIDDMDIVTELWYSPTGEVAPSLPTAGAPVGLSPAVPSQAAEPTIPSAGVSSSSAAASAKRAGGEQEERSGKRLEMSPTKGQKRPAESGGKTSKSKDSRVASAQASKGIKRPPESERPDDNDQCLMNLITEDRDKYLQSIEGQSEPVCEEKIPLPPELEDEAATWFYYDDISGKVLDAKGVEKARRDEIEIIHKMPKGTRSIGTRWVDVNKQDEENPLYRSRLVAQEVKKGSGFDEFCAAMPSLSALKMLVTIAVTFQLPHAGTAVKEAYAKRRLFRFSGCEARPFLLRRDKRTLC